MVDGGKNNKGLSTVVGSWTDRWRFAAGVCEYAKGKIWTGFFIELVGTQEIAKVSTPPSPLLQVGDKGLMSQVVGAGGG